MTCLSSNAFGVIENATRRTEFLVGAPLLSVGAVDAWDGDDAFLSAYLTMPPGAVFPIHR